MNIVNSEASSVSPLPRAWPLYSNKPRAWQGDFHGPNSPHSLQFSPRFVQLRNEAVFTVYLTSWLTFDQC